MVFLLGIPFKICKHTQKRIQNKARRAVQLGRTTLLNMSFDDNKDGGDIILIEQFGKPQATEAGFDGERNLSINCAELRHLRRYLLLVGQWYPNKWNSTKKAFYHIWQVKNTSAT